jgi:hypothetical protein
MPNYVVVARIIIKPTNPLNGSGVPLPIRTPDIWHLAEVIANDKLADTHVCGMSTATVEVRHPVREWKLLEPWCPECDARAGNAAKAQAELEAESY